MNRKLFFILLAGLMTFATVDTFAQDQNTKPGKVKFYAPIAQTSPEGSRFEIVMTSYDDLDTPILFKVDKYTGDVWELSHGFRPLKLTKYSRESSPADFAEEDRINYQFIALSYYSFYLVNLNTGVMWEKTPDDIFKKKNYFQLIKEQ